MTDFLPWRSQNATSNMPAAQDEDLSADVDEPPDFTHSHLVKPSHCPDFLRSEVRPQGEKKESLLTKALHTGPHEEFDPDIQVKTELFRRRSLLSNASLASTMELTSDGGLTSPARTNTPSPPFPSTTTYTTFAPVSLEPKATHPIPPPMISSEKEPIIAPAQDVLSLSPVAEAPVAAPPRKRCITFACGGKNLSERPVTKPVKEEKGGPTPAVTEEAPKKRSIKFACPGPRPSEKTKQEPRSKPVEVSKPGEPLRRPGGPRSPSLTRKPRTHQPSNPRVHRDSTGTLRRASQSPVAVRRSQRPRYIIANELDLQSSDATRFNEFASEEMQEDDWIRRDSAEELSKLKKLTINDTLQKENAIRQLGNEAEQEALDEDEEDEEDDDDGYDSDDEERDEEDDDDATFNGSDYSDDDASDGNETDNEAGFADSDDESDGDGQYQFWTPGRSGEPSAYRPSAHRAASTSSIDSLEHMKPVRDGNDKVRTRTRRIKIRPGTPDLPDSTDFVCGTLDEDRPLEDAYISCMAARKLNHRIIPQDIDPSFPTSDPEDEEDEHDLLEPADDSEEHVWLHGEFEDSDSARHGGRRRRSTSHRSPARSPRRRLRSPPPPTKRLHSPPPAKRRLHSPPPRKLFGHSPKRLRSPPPIRSTRSPATSPTTHAVTAAITFAQLGSRAGVTHTKSLPRAPNAFCRQYRAARLREANGDESEDGNDTHVRSAVDIVKGLEHKRQRRREKFYAKQCNRARKGQPEKRPAPGVGAERMRELGLLMAGKTGQDHHPYILSA